MPRASMISMAYWVNSSLKCNDIYENTSFAQGPKETAAQSSGYSLAQR